MRDLASGGHANTLNGDGALNTSPAPEDTADSFVYDPLNPVPSRGGNVCCEGNALSGGAFDQREIEGRDDVLVYSTEPLKEGLEVTGPIDFTVYLSSDRTDTDVTVKLVDVKPADAAKK